MIVWFVDKTVQLHLAWNVTCWNQKGLIRLWEYTGSYNMEILLAVILSRVNRNFNWDIVYVHCKCL